MFRIPLTRPIPTYILPQNGICSIDQEMYAAQYEEYFEYFTGCDIRVLNLLKLDSSRILYLL